MWSFGAGGLATVTFERAVFGTSREEVNNRRLAAVSM
jgi:hypothetical protein